MTKDSADWQSQAPLNAARDARTRIDRVNDWLHLGGALPPGDYERLHAAGVTHVIDLREESDADTARLATLGIARHHVPVPDHSAPSLAQLVDVARLLGADGESACMYVHCKGGFGRAATMAVGLLVVQGVALDDAVAQVQKARPEMRLNDEQLVWLRELEERRRAEGD
jgi:protein-tyrosine phosphatase